MNCEKCLKIAEILAKNETALLDFAFDENNKDIVKLLIEMGIDVNAENWSGMTPLYWASRKGYTDMVEYLIGKGADVNVCEVDGGYFNTPLHYASMEGYIEIVEILLKAGADVNAKNLGSETAIELASDEGHAEIVKLLKKWKKED